MNAIFFFPLIILCLGTLLIGLAGTWYQVAKLNKFQGIMAIFFPPLLFLFGGLNFTQTKWPYILLLCGSVGSIFLFGYTLLFEGANAL